MLRSMQTAPHDGTKIRVRRKRRLDNIKRTLLSGIAVWYINQWWCRSDVTGSYFSAFDNDLEGWEPYHEGPAP